MYLSRSKKSNITHLTGNNIMQYIKEEYDPNAFLMKDTYNSINISPLLQKDYGGKNDCTLTCITSIINYITNCKHEVNKIYNNVEKIAKKYFYNSNFGTSFITIRTIFNKSLSKYCSKTVKVGYLKNVGYNQDMIMSQIDKKNPMILSMFSDGLGYYKKHSVVVVGYRTYSVNKKRKLFLKIHDNWSKQISYLDYDKISSNSVLHYFS